MDQVQAIQGDEVNEGQNEYMVWVVQYMFLGTNFRKEDENYAKTFLNDQNRTKNRMKQAKCRIARKNRLSHS